MSGTLERVQVEGLDAAMDAVRREATDAGRLEGYRAGRADAAAILALPEASACVSFAAELAGDASISQDRAKSLIALVPKAVQAQPSSYRDKLQSASPTVATSTPHAEPTREDRTAYFSNLGKAVSGTK